MGPSSGVMALEVTPAEGGGGGGEGMARGVVPCHHRCCKGFCWQAQPWGSMEEHATRCGGHEV